MKGKRYFTNEEIEKWNKIMEKGYHKYKLGVHDRTKGLLVFETPSNPRPSGYGATADKFMDYPVQRGELKDVLEYNKYLPFRFNFSFSVIKRRKVEFFDILNKFIECDIETGESKPIIDLKKESYDFKSTEHTIGKNELVRLQYNFTNLLSAMFVTTLIEDTISFFELMWGYTEDGEEQCLLKYPIGSVVSIKDKKGIDYMINGYEFVRPNSLISVDSHKPIISKLGTITNPTILYDLVCIESGMNSGIVRYGNSCIAQESDIVPSRTNNLNIILN